MQGSERVAVFGDLGGWSDQLSDKLRGLGVEADLVLPGGLSLVLLGDLVHRGPDSPGVLRIVERLVSVNPGRVRMVVGNHEGVYLDGPGFVVTEPLDGADTDRLRRWWRQGLLEAAVAVVGSDGESWLCSHAGLTSPTWRDIGSPGSASDAAGALQRLWVEDPERFWRAGRMLDVGVEHTAGPAWAEAGTELYSSWAQQTCPFHQVHGHSSAYDWYRSSWRRAWLAGVGTADASLRHTTVRIEGAHFMGIDPCLGRYGNATWGPLVLDGRIV